MGYIYKIKNDINSKIYIGQTTKTVEKRFYQHIWCATHTGTNNHNGHLYKAIRKYGQEHFFIEIIEKCDNHILNEREMFWIKFYDSMRNGYNHNIGGGSNIILYDEDVMPLWNDGLSLQEISKQLNRTEGCICGILKANNVKSSEIRKRGGDLSRLKTGKTIYRYDIDGNYIDSFLSRNDVYMKLGIARADRACRKNETSGGFRWSYEKVDKLPPSTKIMHPTKVRKRPVIMCDKITHEEIKRFESLREAVKFVGGNCIWNIQCVCTKPNINKTAYGYFWKYA